MGIRQRHQWLTPPSEQTKLINLIECFLPSGSTGVTPGDAIPLLLLLRLLDSFLLDRRPGVEVLDGISLSTAMCFPLRALRWGTQWISFFSRLRRLSLFRPARLAKVARSVRWLSSRDRSSRLGKRATEVSLESLAGKQTCDTQIRLHYSIGRFLSTLRRLSLSGLPGWRRWQDWSCGCHLGTEAPGFGSGR